MELQWPTLTLGHWLAAQEHAVNTLHATSEADYMHHWLLTWLWTKERANHPRLSSQLVALWGAAAATRGVHGVMCLPPGPLRYILAWHMCLLRAFVLWRRSAVHVGSEYVVQSPCSCQPPLWRKSHHQPSPQVHLPTTSTPTPTHILDRPPPKPLKCMDRMGPDMNWLAAGCEAGAVTVGTMGSEGTVCPGITITGTQRV